MAGPVQIRGLDAVNRKLRRLSGAEGKKAIRTALRTALKPMAAEVKSREPRGLTGALKKSVKVRSGRSRNGRITFRVVIGKDAFKGGKFYGAFRDLGTRKLAGAGAMKGAFEADKESTKADAERLILQGIEATINR